jgi:hypothetical protein
MSHSSYYRWGIDWEIPADETVVGANLFIDDLRNWTDGETNVFHTHLLDYAPIGVTSGSDNQYDFQDWFDANYEPAHHHELFERWNLGTTPEDIDYDFDSDELNLLVAYNDKGTNVARFGLGFDPDCHFYNNGITLTIWTRTDGTAVPEPGTMILVGAGLIGLSGAMRRKRKK